MSFQELLKEGKAALGADNWDEAVAVFKRATELEPENQIAWALLGLPQMGLQRLDEAEASLNKALELEPEDPAALASKADVVQQLVRNQEALDLVDRAIGLNPTDPQAFDTKSNALRGLGRPEEALEAIDAALALEPNEPRFRRTRIDVLGDLNRWDEALAEVDERSALRSEGPNAEDRGLRAVILLALERPKEALEDAVRAVEADDTKAAGWYALGSARLALDEVVEAVPDRLDWRPAAVPAIILTLLLLIPAVRSVKVGGVGLENPEPRLPERERLDDELLQNLRPARTIGEAIAPTRRALPPRPPDGEVPFTLQIPRLRWLRRHPQS